MRGLLGQIVGGQSLRHRAVALRADEQHPAGALAGPAGGERDVAARLFPLSLRPLLFGLARGADEPGAGPLELRMTDRRASAVLGTLHLVPMGTLSHSGRCLDVLGPTASSVHCTSAADLAWRYALAWRQVRRTARDPQAFTMSFADLRALNVFYMLPRPVHLVSVVCGDAGNLFPMDLVGPLGDDMFLLALRLTSPSVELMRESGRIVVSAVPAAWKEVAYRLGDHHRQRTIAWDALPFPVAPSPAFGIPAPVGSLGLREIEVERCEVFGSHMLFVGSIMATSAAADAPQLCHVSDMYARWRAARGAPFTAA